MSDRKAVIKNADMNEEMQQDAVDFATQALEKFNIEKVSGARGPGPRSRVRRRCVACLKMDKAPLPLLPRKSSPVQ